jgi:hypothetical protein
VNNSGLEKGSNMHNELESQRATRELKKLDLEIQDLELRTGWLGRLSNLLWPIIATVLTVLLTYSTARMSQQQSEQEERNKRREILDRAVNSATDNSSMDRRFAGIWALDQFWTDKDNEQTVASTLAAELTLSDDKSLASCAAAEVIGNGLQGPESYVGGSDQERSARIARFLYGYRDGTLGIVSRINVYLQRTQNRTRPHSVDEVVLCTNALDASKEAIRKNWEYLRDTNLNDTDLTGAGLYEADLAHSVMNRADLREADLRCANLAGVQATDINLDSGTRLNFANLGVSEDHSQITLPTVPDRYPHLLHLSDEQWRQWRQLKFPVDDHYNPVFDNAHRCTKAPCDAGVSDPTDWSTKAKCDQ